MERHTFNRYTLTLLFLLLPGIVFSAPPSRTYTYVADTAISPTEVTTNEDNLYRYVQQGVDKLADNSVTTDKISDGTIVNADISTSAAIIYSKLNLTGAILNADLAGSIADNKLSQITTASKVNGAALTGLASIPSGAGLIPTANIPSIYDDTRCKVGSITREMDAGNGVVAYTGVGFKPTSIIFIGVVNESTVATYGFTDASSGGAVVPHGTNWTLNASAIYLVYSGSAGDQYAVLTSFDSNGFTLTWTKDGSPASNTATIYYLAFR